MYIDGSLDSEKSIRSMISWDVMNGLARRSWARNIGAISTVEEAGKLDPKLVVTTPNLVEEDILANLIKSLDDSI